MSNENEGTSGTGRQPDYVAARPVVGKRSLSTAGGSSWNRGFVASSNSGRVNVRFIPRQSDRGAVRDVTS